MARPTDSASWAGGASRRLEPTTPQKDDGFNEGTRTPARHANWAVGVAADWAAYLESITDANDEHVYPTPPTRTLVIPAIAGQPLNAAAWVLATVAAWNSPGVPDQTFVAFPIRLPSGSTLTEVRVEVNPAAARASSSRMELQVGRVVYDYTIGGVTITQLGSTVEDDGTANVQILALTGLTHVVDRSDEQLHVLVRCGNAGGAGADIARAPQLTFTDIGPRNF